ncbi:bifunctional DNA-formamidopyrimidine glycosylase/DNA-(apurinic or apyrimidinic site) lyase [Parvularcula sp. ZS-1/3]|uniref:Formamidopyrimidine-DNA glycosylase n=1 Tax=Parvularcula mediterranea TaxID=2732508 RepID=A0A7Y3RP24_9PROT|nr:bifunctional DNA-formamidopyrimidine glycosylase/DNA-(apurinic or apyrimidinic site) lyase [Parvularcula mediterranea]NNU17638.1 bifunctional DNA-formamidopyrimidine glycosylase/DNA-(apurinic or apyrimidinic site) lyase [Parvularcula mediterranea]
MPELPEVETVRRGLEPAMKGARIVDVDQRRPDLRFPFPERFRERLEGATVMSVGRRAKFLVMPLDTGETLLGHLGMTGRFTVKHARQTLEPGAFYAPDPPRGHEHLALTLRQPGGDEVSVTYADPRRFGFFELEKTATLDSLPRMAKLGPEPLGESFTPEALIDKVRGRAMPLKSALLDQSIVAGLGNIYVCEALFRAGLSPKRKAGTLGPKRAERLVAEIKDVLAEAIEAGGSTLRDYASADGKEGAFQQRFFVYDREGSDCPTCGKDVVRYVQSGRSTFACTQCQR